MTAMTVRNKYPLIIRILHWLMALLIIGLLIVGLIMTGMDKDDPNRSLLFALHKSFGLTVLMLAALRLVLKLLLGGPPLPMAIPFFERLLATLGHWALYAFMFAMPISGYVLSTSFGLPVKWFGIPMPKLVGIDKTRGELAGDFHEFAAYALIMLLLIHVGAVAIHYFKERVNLLKRMI
jgi:cytochrome b561